MADREVTNITHLPLDILVLIFPYLDPKTFLALCGTCKALHQPSLRLDPAYWSHATRSTFRVPNQPVVQHDGARWQKLYRRMLTQSRVYTWGLATRERLGHSGNLNSESMGGWHIGRLPRHIITHRTDCRFPKEMDQARDYGVIADLQCGGWSTTILTSTGILFTAGVIDGERSYYASQGTTPLRFPSGYPGSQSAAVYTEPTTAIRQFSAGRKHILGLSDSGRIWSWSHKHRTALGIKFVNVCINEGASRKILAAKSGLYGQVKQVVAGWSCSSAYIHGYGIVLWSPVGRENDPPTLSGNDEEDEESDTMLVLENTEVPRTGYHRPTNTSRESEDERILGEEVGAVINYIILEQFVVFVTDLGKVFCSRLGAENKVEEILELKSLGAREKVAMDIQGSFRRFAVFRNGEVLIAEQNYLDACWGARIADPEQTNIQGIKVIPALQHSGVISVAFGDYHFLALHSSGKITSYGTELQSCGALGLGGDGGRASELRGLCSNGDGPSSDVRLVPHAYTHGRQVWFRPEQDNWIKYLGKGGKDTKEASERMGLFRTDRNVQGEVSEWIEQEGRSWDKDKGEDGLGAHFALRVSAAGWHSGAVVLVNDDIASKGAVYNWRGKSFPRLKLSDGREMPGSIDFDSWQEGIPEWKLDIDVL